MDDAEWDAAKQASYDFHRDFARLFAMLGEEKNLYQYCIV